MKIYLASSWRNEYQPEVLFALRGEGHQVYDFRHPEPGNEGFKWSDIDPQWAFWNAEAYREGLKTQVAKGGFEFDMVALMECDACVLLLPCGRSAHIEAGWARGAGKKLYILFQGENEPELMYMMADAICVSVGELLYELRASAFDTYAYNVEPFEPMCRVCGCTEGHACPKGCHWVEEDLCSACQEKSIDHLPEANHG